MSSAELARRVIKVFQHETNIFFNDAAAFVPHCGSYDAYFILNRPLADKNAPRAYTNGEAPDPFVQPRVGSRSKRPYIV